MGVFSPTGSLRLARSESLKAQGEGRRRGSSAGVEAVPRSRSNVDMEDYGEERLLGNSTSSSTSSTSASVSVELSEGDSGEVQNWQETVDPQTLLALGPREVDRQAVIYELYTTEVSHLRTLRVLDQVFFQNMQAVLSLDQLTCIFPNLPQVYRLHNSLCESMKNLRESPIVQGIGDIMLARFGGVAGAEFLEEVSLLCSQQSQSLELIKNKQKDPRFSQIIQECELSPLCRRLQLKDLLVSETQRLTKYPLLLDNIIRHTHPLSPDLLPLQRAQACCRGILQAVNEVVRETEHKQRLSQYQRRLDLTPLERQTNPVAAQFKNLDLRTKRMIHEAPLTWRVSKEKTIEVQALLLSDLLVLLQKGPDDRMVLRFPSRSLGGGVSGEIKTTSCPVVRLDSLLVRSVATDNKALYLISAAEGQIYELAARTSSEKNTWKDLLEKTISLASTSSGSANHDLKHASVSAAGIQSDDSFSECSVSIERDTANDEEGVSMAPPPSDQSGSFLVDKGRDGRIADAALQDVEILRQLIFRDLEEDGWSHDSDDTPTKETANERCLFRRGALSQEEESRVQVVRKAKGAGFASIPDDIIDDVSSISNQSDNPKGNTFYLTMPEEPGETQTEEDCPPPTALPSGPGQEVTSLSPSQEDMGQGLYPPGQSQDRFQRLDARQSQSEPGIPSHLINNVEIFSTIERLMGRLQQLREIEAAHYQLLKTLTDQPVNQVSDDSLQTGAADGKEPTHPPPEIQSTGF